MVMLFPVDDVKSAFTYYSKMVTDTLKLPVVCSRETLVNFWLATTFPMKDAP
jgi:hypothetical protein